MSIHDVRAGAAGSLSGYLKKGFGQLFSEKPMFRKDNSALMNIRKNKNSRFRVESGVMELLARFELATSSLPMVYRTLLRNGFEVL